MEQLRGGPTEMKKPGVLVELRFGWADRGLGLGLLQQSDVEPELKFHQGVEHRVSHDLGVRRGVETRIQTLGLPGQFVPEPHEARPERPHLFFVGAQRANREVPGCLPIAEELEVATLICEQILDRHEGAFLSTATYGSTSRGHSSGGKLTMRHYPQMA